MSGGPTTGIRILLVDDHQILREALAEHLSQQADFEVVASVSTQHEAIACAAKARPDVALVDIEIPGLDTFVAAEEIMKGSDATRVLFLSAFCRDHYIEQALSVGAAGYVLKDEEPETLHLALRQVAAGGTFFSEEVEGRLIVGDDGLRLARPGATRIASLTKREREVLRYIALGMAKKEVAQLVDLSVRTVDAHVRNIMSKLDLHDRVELARFAIREGLVSE